MAAAQTHRYLARPTSTDLADQIFEFDEADVWSNTDPNPNQPQTRKPVSNPRPLRRKTADVDRAPIRPNSLPVNIPDWSKILRGEYKARAGDCTDDHEYEEDEEEEEDGNDRMAPHEYLARTRVASLSVHEGIGRTLKGRDLSRLRNAIWKKTGFED